MWCDSRVSLLAFNLATPCFGREPKGRVATKLIHEVCNEFFYPISFDFQFYLAQYITRGNNIVITKHQVPLRMSKQITLNLYEMVDFKNKIGLF
jgi:hypothetical protein